VKEVALELGVSEATIYTWKTKYGGMEVSEARRLKELEDENRRLKHMVADLVLQWSMVRRAAPTGWRITVDGASQLRLVEKIEAGQRALRVRGPTVPLGKMPWEV